ncbi:MAG: polysaccharide deacetylase family protein [Desulfitobacteriaceae bacterium]
MLILIRTARIWVLLGIVILFLGGLFTTKWVLGLVATTIKPIEQINTAQKAMALTINVDWGEEYIPGILQELDKGKVKATFFLTGRWAKNHPDLVRVIAEAGHQIENHGYSHPHPDRLSVKANQAEIKKTEEIILGITGNKTHYYAPPYGEKGITGLEAAKELGYTTILWTLDTVDWRPESTPELIAKRVLNPERRFGTKPNKCGAIVLMHPKENTLKALPLILMQLAQEGYSLKTINELITLDNIGNTTS